MAKNNLTMDDLEGMPFPDVDMLGNPFGDGPDGSYPDTREAGSDEDLSDYSDFKTVFQDAMKAKLPWGRFFQEKADAAYEQGDVTAAEMEVMQEELNNDYPASRGCTPDDLYTPIFTPGHERTIYNSGSFVGENPGFWCGDAMDINGGPQGIVKGAEGTYLFPDDADDSLRKFSEHLEKQMDESVVWHDQTLDFNFDAPEAVMESYKHDYAKQCMRAMLASFEDNNGMLCHSLSSIVSDYQDEFEAMKQASDGLSADKLAGLSPVEVAQRVETSGKPLSEDARRIMGQWAVGEIEKANGLDGEDRVDAMYDIQSELMKADEIINKEDSMTRKAMSSDMRICVVDKESAMAVAESGINMMSPVFYEGPKGFEGTYSAGYQFSPVKSRCLDESWSPFSNVVAVGEMDTIYGGDAVAASSLWVREHLDNAAFAKFMDAKTFDISISVNPEETMVFEDVMKAREAFGSPDGLLDDKANAMLKDAGYDTWEQEYEAAKDGNRKETLFSGPEGISFDPTQKMPEGQPEKEYGLESEKTADVKMPVRVKEQTVQEPESRRNKAVMPEVAGLADAEDDFDKFGR